jgi:hypothetical protein
MSMSRLIQCVVIDLFQRGKDDRQAFKNDSCNCAINTYITPLATSKHSDSI